MFLNRFKFVVYSEYTIWIEMMFEKERVRERERNKERGMLYKNFIYFSRVKKKAYQKKKKSKWINHDKIYILLF